MLGTDESSRLRKKIEKISISQRDVFYVASVRAWITCVCVRPDDKGEGSEVNHSKEIFMGARGYANRKIKCLLDFEKSAPLHEHP